MFTDPFAVSKFESLIRDFNINTVIETGTYYAGSTLRFAEYVDHVYTIDTNIVFADIAADRVRVELGYLPARPKFFPRKRRTLLRQLLSNRYYTIHRPLYERRFEKDGKSVTVIRGSSPTVLTRILPHVPGPICFYLDAHWGVFWPILAELRAIRARPESVIIIDDFKVPGKPFGYDSYRGQPLDFNFVRDALFTANPQYQVSYNEQVAGPRSRGILYATPPR